MINKNEKMITGSIVLVALFLLVFICKAAWQGTIDGVLNPSDIQGIPVANIDSIIGVGTAGPGSPTNLAGLQYWASATEFETSTVDGLRITGFSDFGGTNDGTAVELDGVVRWFNNSSLNQQGPLFAFRGSRSSINGIVGMQDFLNGATALHFFAYMQVLRTESNNIFRSSSGDAQIFITNTVVDQLDINIDTTGGESQPSFFTTGDFTNDFHLYEVLWDGTTKSILTNGVLITNTALTGVMTTLGGETLYKIGERVPTTEDTAYFFLNELIIFDRELTVNERQVNIYDPIDLKYRTDGDGPNASLQDDLVIAYSFEEDSGIRQDFSVINMMDLAAINSPTNITGINGQALRASRADNSYLRYDNTLSDRFFPISNDIHVAIWVNMQAKEAGSMTFMGNDSPGNAVLVGHRPAPDRFVCFAEESGGGLRSVTNNNLGSPATGTWYFVEFQVSGSDLRVRTDLGTWDENIGVFTKPFRNSTQFFVGNSANIPTTTCNCFLDQPSYHHRLLTEQESTNLFDSGAGLAGPF